MFVVLGVVKEGKMVLFLGFEAWVVGEIKYFLFKTVVCIIVFLWKFG